MARSDQVRHQLFLPKEVSDRLDSLARAPGASKSKILAEALASWLDRLSNQLARIERDGHVQLESLALFVRYMLAVNAPLPEGDEAARAVARDRFAAFIQRVGQQLASGRLTLLPEEER